MVSPLLYGEGLPNLATGETYQFRGFSIQYEDIIKSNLVRLTVAEANAGISNWDLGSWSISTFNGYGVDGTTGRSVSSGGYIFFETDDGTNPVTPWRPWWPKASARNTYYGLNASGQGNPLDEFEYFAGNFYPVESDKYYTSDVRNQVFKPSADNDNLRKWLILSLYNSWLLAQKSTSNPCGVSLHVPSQSRYAVDSIGMAQAYIQYGYTSYSTPNNNTAPYSVGNALVTPICKTDGTSSSSPSYNVYGVGDWFYTPSELYRYVGAPVVWGENPINQFVTFFHTIDQYQTSAYVGASAPDIYDSQLPLYMANNNTMQRMSVSQILSEYVLPAIDLMCGNPNTAGLAGNDRGAGWEPYTVSTSSSVSGYTRVSSEPIFTDYRATDYYTTLIAGTTPHLVPEFNKYFSLVTAYELQSSYFPDGSEPTTSGTGGSAVTNWYLHRKSFSITYALDFDLRDDDGPFVTLQDSTFQPYSMNDFIQYVLRPLFEWAMVNYSGYRVRYVITPSTRALADSLNLNVDRQLGSTMVNTSLDTISGIYTINTTNNDYRTQVFPTGSSTDRNYYGLNIVRY